MSTSNENPGGGSLLVLACDELAANPAAAGTGFDAAVANLALLAQPLAPVLRPFGRPRSPRGGALIIQAGHP